jgi:hypothetical protein
MTEGIPLSIRVASMPSMLSFAFPVGSNAPQLEPAVSAKVIGIAAAAPGTPSIRADPA